MPDNQPIKISTGENIINSIILMIVKSVFAWVLIGFTLVPLLLYGGLTNSMEIMLSEITAGDIKIKMLQFVPFIGEWIDVAMNTYDIATSVSVTQYATHHLLNLIFAGLLAIIVYLMRRFSHFVGSLLEGVQVSGFWVFVSEFPSNITLAAYATLYATLVTNLIKSFASPDHYLLWAIFVLLVLVILCFVARKSTVLTLDKLGEFLTVALCTALMYVVILCIQLIPVMNAFGVVEMIIYMIVFVGSTLAVTMIPCIALSRSAK